MNLNDLDQGKPVTVTLTTDDVNRFWAAAEAITIDASRTVVAQRSMGSQIVSLTPVLRNGLRGPWAFVARADLLDALWGDRR